MNRSLAFLGLLCLVSCSSEYDYSKPLDRDPREVPFVTTPQVIVDRMLEWCEPKSDDYVLDLGCGDGRIIITAAKKYGCRGIGYDIDPKLINLCRKNAKREGVEDLVEFVQQDIYEAKLPTDATIVTMYLYPNMNLRLMPFLQTLKDGVRVVSHRWEMPGVPELKKEKHTTGVKLLPEADIYFFKTPMLVDPNWVPPPNEPEEVDFNKIKDKLKFSLGG